MRVWCRQCAGASMCMCCKHACVGGHPGVHSAASLSPFPSLCSPGQRQQQGRPGLRPGWRQQRAGRSGAHGLNSPPYRAQTHGAQVEGSGSSRAGLEALSAALQSTTRTEVSVPRLLRRHFPTICATIMPTTQAHRTKQVAWGGVELSWGWVRGGQGGGGHCTCVCSQCRAGPRPSFAPRRCVGAACTV